MKNEKLTTKDINKKYGKNLKITTNPTEEWVEQLTGIEFEYRIKNQTREKEEINETDPMFVGREWKHTRELSAVIFPKDGDTFEIELAKVELTTSMLQEGREAINTVAGELQEGEGFRYIEVLKNLKKSGIKDITQDSPNRDSGVIEGIADDKDQRQMLRDWADIVSIVEKEKLKQKKIKRKKENRELRKQAVATLSKRALTVPASLKNLYGKTKISMKNLNSPKSETPSKGNTRKI